MFFHKKNPIHAVKVDEANPLFAQLLMKALDSLGKLTEPLFGNIQPDETVALYYNLSSNGDGKDERGPWNAEPDFRYVADPLRN
jgi:Mn-containing catalase